MSSNKRKFRAGGMANVIDCQSRKHKALSSNPNTTKRRRKRRKFEHK
jgi:hypothetical protein